MTEGIAVVAPSVKKAKTYLPQEPNVSQSLTNLCGTHPLVAARESEDRYKLYSWYLEPWLMLLSPAFPPLSYHKRCLQGSDSLESGPRLGRLWQKIRVLTRAGCGPQQARGSPHGKEERRASPTLSSVKLGPRPAECPLSHVCGLDPRSASSSAHT